MKGYTNEIKAAFNTDVLNKLGNTLAKTFVAVSDSEFGNRIPGYKLRCSESLIGNEYGSIIAHFKDGRDVVIVVESRKDAYYLDAVTGERNVIDSFVQFTKLVEFAFIVVNQSRIAVLRSERRKQKEINDHLVDVSQEIEYRKRVIELNKKACQTNEYSQNIVDAINGIDDYRVLKMAAMKRHNVVQPLIEIECTVKTGNRNIDNTFGGVNSVFNIQGRNNIEVSCSLWSISFNAANSDTAKKYGQLVMNTMKVFKILNSIDIMKLPVIDLKDF